MSDVRKLGIPFLLIFVSAFVAKLLTTYVVFENSATFLKVLIVTALCLFGATLNTSKARHGSVWKKVIAILIVIFLLFMQLNLFTFSNVNQLFQFFGVDAFYVNMLYIFCGYLFVD